MTKIERTLRDLSDLYEFYASLQEWKKTATIRASTAEAVGASSRRLPHDPAELAPEKTDAR